MRFGTWYAAWRAQQDRALAGPMPPSTRYAGERLTIHRKNDTDRYRDMIAAKRASQRAQPKETDKCPPSS